MKASIKCLNLITSFEGLRLIAYKDPVGVLTIGYGHTKNVKENQIITRQEAEALLLSDLAVFENRVMKYDNLYHWTQSEFDALVSFAFNIGSIDQLTNYGDRSKAQIADKMLKYVKAGGVTLSGLVRRRKAERALFLEKIAADNIDNVVKDILSGKYGNNSARRINLERAGYDYVTVQKEVNSYIVGKRKRISSIVKAVLRGDFDNGELRKKRLVAAGYDPDEVQKAVNAYLKGK